MDHIIWIFAGHGSEQDSRNSNSVRLGGEYNGVFDISTRRALALEVPDELLSPAGRNLVRLMDGDFTGGPVGTEQPQAIIRRKRVGVTEAASILGHPASAAQVLVKAYGEDSVGEDVVDEYLPDLALPSSHMPATLARQINHLARSAGLHVRTAAGTIAVDEEAATIDCTKQAQRWARMLDRAVQSASAA